MRKKIAAALAVGVVAWAIFAAPITAPIVEAASESVMDITAASTLAEQGEKLFLAGKYAEAAEVCEKAAELAKNNEQYWTSAGFSYYKAERWDKAAICYKKGIKINPNNGLAHFYCGMAYFNQAFVPHHLSTRTIFERAAEHGDRAAELLPDDVSVRMAAGLIQESLAGQVGSGREKHLSKAYQNYCKAIDLDPNNTNNTATLSRFVQRWSRYGFQPYPPTTQRTGANSTTGTMTQSTISDSTLQDLCGDYRIVWETRAMRAYHAEQKGNIVSFVMEDGAFIGKKKEVSGKPTDHNYITNVYIENGTAHCTLNIQGLRARTDCWIRPSNNGAVVEIVDNDPIHGDEPVFFELHRI